MTRPTRPTDPSTKKKISKSIKELNDYIWDLDYIYDCENVQKFFEYFQYEYGFDYDKEYYKESNSLEIFYDLDKFMGWFNYVREQEKIFYELNYYDKIFYLKKFLQNFDDYFDDNLTWRENFNYLKRNYLDIYKSAKDFINFFTNESLEDRFKNYRDLKNIILKYNLRKEEEIPNKIKEMKEILQDELFVNIYDFVKGNKKAFKSIDDLHSYTEENKLFFDLEKAKRTFTYRVLLKDIFDI